jgi:hypothetical protein
MILVLLASACSDGAAPDARRVILVGVDGAALPIVQEGIAAGRLPAFAQLMREGAVGPLASIRRDLPYSPERGPGWWSPLVWNSIATGRPPEVHGVIDFRLPDPASMRLCTRVGGNVARVTLPNVPNARGVRLARAPERATRGWTVRIGERSFALDDGDLRDLPLAGEGALAFVAGEGAHGPLCLRSLDLIDANGNRAYGLHFAAEQARFGSGWAAPEHGPIRTAGNDHRRARAFWNIASDTGRTVAIVGWRDSWPVERVRGTYVSDRLGLRVASRPERFLFERDVTHPPEFAARAEPWLARVGEVDAATDRTLLDTGDCALDPSTAAVSRISAWSDWLRHSLALELWDSAPEIDLLAVYYAGIDHFGHSYQPDRVRRDGHCYIDPPLVDRYYAVVDRLLADWLERLDDDTTLLVVTDHGMEIAPGSGEHGEHADNGFAMLAGADVQRAAALADAHVLDVAPTVLYLLGLALGEDLEGDVLWPALAPGLRTVRPARSVPTWETGAPAADWAEPSPEVEEAVVERLRALGYVD